MIPRIPLGEWVEALVEWIAKNLSFLLDAISELLGWALDLVGSILGAFPALAFVLLASVLTLFLTRKILLTVGVSLGLLLIDNMGLWSQSMETLSLVLVAAGAAVLIGIPLGILSARNARAEAVTRVFLDFMQTMPSFVYLIPVVIFFGLGNVPGMIATVVFALPPMVRLTTLGIRQVPVELNEVADSFGSSTLQKLMNVQMPVAMPSIRAGINQCVMLSLSMVVIASMIGARGLGYNVLVSIQRIDVAMGFEAGLAIVILAVVLDRVTQNVGGTAVTRRRPATSSTKASAPGLSRRKGITAAATLVVAAALIFAAMGLCGTGDAGGEKLRFGYVTWDGEVASTNVLTLVLEEAGFDVEMVPVDAGPLYQGLSQGSLDLTTSAWLPVTHQSYMGQYGSSLDRVAVNLEGCRIGMAVPQYVYDAGVTTIADLNEHADRFDSRIVGIEPGAGVVMATEAAIEEYALDGYRLQTSSSGAMLAELRSAYEKEEWIAVTLWSPHWAFSEWDMAYLDDPLDTYGGAEVVETISRLGLSNDSPKAYAIIEAFEWSLDDCQSVMLDIFSNGMDEKEAAQKWIDANRDKVDSWIAAGEAAGSG